MVLVAQVIIVFAYMETRDHKSSQITSFSRSSFSSCHSLSLSVVPNRLVDCREHSVGVREEETRA